MKKNAVITGSSSELGLKIAQSLEKEYNLILLTNKNIIAKSLFHTKPTILKCNFLNNEELEEMSNFILKKYNKIDLLINCAARSIDNAIDDISSEEFLATLEVNVVAPFILIKKLIKTNGIVINICSTDGIDTFNEYNLTYATSKAALIHLTKQLSYIYKDVKIYGLVLNYINTLSTNNMEPNYLKQELKRIKQKHLIEIDDIIKEIQKLIDTIPLSGTITRMDG